jgi:chemotaxis protein methyltransferase CheR
MIEPELTLSDRDLRTITRLVYERSGISLHDGKRALVVARLQKRIRTGGFRGFGDYVRHVERDATGEEIVRLLDAIATNHTSFFREPQHFEFLAHTLVPGLLARTEGPIEAWSAACSTGEEPYTIAMTLLDALPEAVHDRIAVFGSDLSTKALGTARAGVYRMERVAEVPAGALRRHFEKGLGPHAGLARVHPRVQRMVRFERLNLLEIGDLGRRFPLIFCRNVMIYFDRQVQQQVVSMVERHLAPGGYLFIAHSESLNGIAHGLQWVAPAIYRRRDV